METCDICEETADSCPVCWLCIRCCNKEEGQHLINLSLGTPFESNKVKYIRLMPVDAEDIYCLNTDHKCIEEFFNEVKVKPIKEIKYGTV